MRGSEACASWRPARRPDRADDLRPIERLLHRPDREKAPQSFLPGTPVLSFGTAGCNLACKFCQNWDISKSREIDTLADEASPEAIAEAAMQLGCRSVAFTYNDPVIFMEYAIDVARACLAHGVTSVAVTAGYICPEPRGEFYRHMDAANVDFKGFTERFYHKVCRGHLQPVLDTLVYLKHETEVWFEITTLLIPDENDTEGTRRDDALGRRQPRSRGAHALHGVSPGLSHARHTAHPDDDLDAGETSRSRTGCATRTPATSTTRRRPALIVTCAARCWSAAIGTCSAIGTSARTGAARPAGRHAPGVRAKPRSMGAETRAGTASGRPH